MASSTVDSFLEAALADSSPSSTQDMVVVVVHACLISAGYDCVATGDENFGEESTSLKPAISSPIQPALPEGWNSSQEVCALQYRHNATNQCCLVKGIPLGGQLLISAVAACNSSEVFTTTVGVADYVREKDKDGTRFSSKRAFTDLPQLVTVINNDVVSKLTNVCTSAGIGIPSGVALVGGDVPGGAGQRRNVPDFDDDPLRVGPPRHPRMPPDRRSDPLRVEPPLRPGRPVRDPDPLVDVGPFGYGDRDQLPFGGAPGPGRLGPGMGGGGGMIFDPLRQGGIGGYGPRGPFPPSHPPGARFDPVTPFAPPHPPSRPPRNPERNFYGTPDPDHLPPPGGYDDMFS